MAGKNLALPRIECVSTVTCDDPFTAPECRTLRLKGVVFGHPRFEDGSFVTTGPVVDISWKDRWALTYNTRYEIGSLDPKFIEFCRNLEHKGPGTKEFLEYAGLYMSQ